MEKYTVKSVFPVAGQIVHINIEKNGNVLEVALPIKFNGVLHVGDRVGVFSVMDNKSYRVAYKFNKHLCFGMRPYDRIHARLIYNSVAGLRKCSFDKIRLLRAVNVALRNYGMNVNMPLTKKMMLLDAQNQK